MKSKDTLIAWILTAVTMLSWTGVVFFARSIGDTGKAHVADIQDIQRSSLQQSAVVRTHVLAQKTAQDRAQLDQLLTVDVGKAATMLRGVGKITHVDVKLSSAVPEAPPVVARSGTQIQAVGFAVQTDGTFEALMRTAQLLETLPLASSIEHFDIQRTGDSGGTGPAPWHMSVYIRVLTTAIISS